MKPIVSEVRGQIPADIETAFDVLLPIDPATILKGYGPLPAVEGVEDQTGAWNAVGDSRILRLAGGSAMVETLTGFDRPRHFSCTLIELTHLLRLLVSSLRGVWDLEEAEHVGTTPIVNVRWRMEFRSRSILTWPLAWLLVKMFWGPYAEDALARASVEVVEAFARPGP